MRKASHPNHGQLSIVGAGPGDPDLITVKGVRAIQSADVILYDALANKALLKYARPGAQQVFVGKKPGNHAYSQDEIHALIGHFALQGLHVVRLKGGDPFVFGRGHEEWSYAEALGIPVTIVPGVTSAIAVPETLGIPVTHRTTSESFWVITGTTSAQKLSKDIELAAQSSATVVILMGMRKLRTILDLFSRFGKGHIPAAVIMAGTTSKEKAVISDVQHLADEVEKIKLDSPAIIVVGETVALHRSKEWEQWSQTFIAEKP